ncbi:MAG: hypothetical protein ACLPID_20225 [Beijerinckiaceae bacterium]
MPREARRRDRLVGLFALGVVLFNPPVLWLFADATLFGWPLLFVYLFCAWAVFTALIALTVERKRTRSSNHVGED